NAGAGANVGVAASANDDEADVEAGAGADAAVAATEAEDEDAVDQQTTAAIDASSQLGATLQAFGEAGGAFFTDEAQTQMAPGAEFSAAFNALSAEQQAQLRTACEADVQGASATAFCESVQGL